MSNTSLLSKKVKGWIEIEGGLKGAALGVEGRSSAGEENMLLGKFC